jgi:ribosomal protein S18 acetylase RimI-like enzyme
MNERPVTIRRATLGDLEDVLKMERTLVRHDRQFDATLDPGWPDREEGRAWFRERIAGRDGVVLIARDGGKTIGYLVGGRCAVESYRHAPPMAEVDCLCVAASRRGGGLGSRLMRRFLKGCARRGIGRVRVVVCAENAGAIRFYRHMGFAPYDVVLERTLPSATRSRAASSRRPSAKGSPRQRTRQEHRVPQHDRRARRQVEGDRQPDAAHDGQRAKNRRGRQHASKTPPFLQRRHRREDQQA